MTMNVLNSYFRSISTVVILVLLFLITTSLSFDQQRLSTAPQGSLMEQEIRLGSAPPSCHNKCNQCRPCLAVQVPTFKIRGRVQPGLGSTVAMEFVDSPAPSSSPLSSSKKYSNYKPLGWKCRCGNSLFNP